MLGALWLLVTRRAPGSVNHHRHHHLKLLPAAWLGLCIFHTLTYGDARYRVIGLPLLVVFITIALADFVRNRIPASIWKLIFIPPEPDLPCAICQGRPVLVEGGSVMPCICASAPRN